MQQSIYFIRCHLPLAGLPYMLMMKGGQRFSIVYIYTNIKKEVMNEPPLAQMAIGNPI